VFLRLVIFAISCFAAHATTLVVPGANTGTEGNDNNGFPFNLASFDQTSMRFQQVYSASEFPGAILISGIDFRPDGGLQTSASAFSSIL